MSVTDLLLDVCPRPTYYTHPDQEPKVDLEGVVEIDGLRHETLAEAAEMVKDQGFHVEAFDLVLAVIRNPYDIEVSRFAYYQKGHAWDAHHAGRDHALAGDFRTFALTTSPHGGYKRSLERFFLLDGVHPGNLRVARYERLSTDVVDALTEAGIPVQGRMLPQLNTSTHAPWRTYYDAETEAAVFERYRWVFESGFYPRLDATGTGKGLRPNGH